jgi:hypothetical protein
MTVAVPVLSDSRGASVRGRRPAVSKMMPEAVAIPQRMAKAISPGMLSASVIPISARHRLMKLIEAHMKHLIELSL